MSALADELRAVVREELDRALRELREHRAGAAPPSRADADLSVSDVMAVTGASDRVVRHWLTTGQLVGHRYPGSRRWRIRPADLEAFRSSHPGEDRPVPEPTSEDVKRVLLAVGRKVGRDG